MSDLVLTHEQELVLDLVQCWRYCTDLLAGQVALPNRHSATQLEAGMALTTELQWIGALVPCGPAQLGHGGAYVPSREWSDWVDRVPGFVFPRDRRKWPENFVRVFASGSHEANGVHSADCNHGPNGLDSRNSPRVAEERNAR